MATIKVFNDIFDDKSEDFIYDTSRPLLEQIEEHIDTDVYKTTMVECYDPSTGETFYAPMEDDDDNNGVLIVVDGKSVDKDYQPKDTDIVNVIFTPLGSQNQVDKAATGGILGFLLGAATAVVLAIAFPLAIGVGAAVALTAIGTGLGVLAGWGWGALEDKYGAKHNVQKPKKESKQLPDVRGCSNQSLVGNNFPFVVGKHLISPFVIADPYTEYTGERGKDAYIRTVLCAGYAPLLLTDFKLGEFMLAYNQKKNGLGPDTGSMIAGLLKGYSTGGVADNGDIVDYWQYNDIEIEILQQPETGTGIGYGTIFPDVKKEQQIDANCFYIADKQLQENIPVSYKGVSFPNMYRTNTIIFTEACPMEFTINLDFQSGLFSSHNHVTETSGGSESETVYEAIPLWMCIQWRNYSTANAESDATGADFDFWNTINFGSAYNKLFDTAAQDADKNAHRGNDFDNTSTNEKLYGYFRGKTLQNFQPLSGNGGIDETRVSATVTLTKQQCEQIVADTNPGRIIEIRILRISPNYMNQTGGDEPYSYSDHVKVSTIVTKIFDEQELTDNDTLQPVKICSESDLKKLCLIAVKAKADQSGYIQNNFDKINCIAESFSPYWSPEEKKILPEGITKQTKYYGYYIHGTNTKTNRSTTADEREVTKEQYEEARHEGYNWYEEKLGSTFPSIIKGLVFSNHTTHNDTDAWYLSNDSLPYVHGDYSKQVSSGFLLGCFGAQSGPEGCGLEDINILSIADWAEKTFGLIDGTKFTRTTTYYGTTYNRNDLVPLRMEANAYIYNGIKIEDFLQKVAFAGRAVWVVDETGKIKVVFDGPVDYTKGAIAAENCISSSNAYSYEEPPAGMFVQFNDENDGYENNSFYVWTDGNTLKNHHGTVEQFSADYVTQPYQMFSLARYTQACKVLNKEMLTRKIGPGGVIYSLGDVVLIQGKDLLIGETSGRIQEVIEDNNKIYGFITDATYEYTGELSDGVSVQGVTVIQQRYMGKSNAVTIALSAPVSLPVGDKTYVLQPGTTNMVIFAPVNGTYGLPKGDDDPSPTTTPKYKMQTGDIVLYGLVDKTSAPYRIIKIKPEAGGAFSETLIPYNEELYNSGAALPSFQTYITPPQPTIDPSPVSDVPNTQADLNKSLNNVYNAIGVVKDLTPPATPSSITSTASRDYITVTWSQLEPGKVKYTIVEMSKDGGTTWSTVEKIKADSYKYYFTRSGTGSDGYPEASNLQNYKFRLTSVSTFDVQSTPSSTIDTITTNYGTWQPANPSFVSKIPLQGGVDLTWNSPATSVSGKQLYGNNRFELTVKYNGTSRQVISTSATKASYEFIRTRDGYPEKVHDTDIPGLDLYTFDLKVSNESGKYAEITNVSFISGETNYYGTWIPFVDTTYITTKNAEQDGINIGWKSADNFYGVAKYTVEIKYNGVTRASVNTDALQLFYVFDRSVDGYPELHYNAGAGDTDLSLYTVTLTATNSLSELSNRSTTTSAVQITANGYKTWKIPTMSVQSEVLDRTAILTAIYTGDNIYGTPQLMARIKRRGNLDDINGQTFNQYLGITEDTIYFEPEFEESPQPSSTSNTELNYRKVYPKVTTMPQSPNEGDIVLYDGTTGTYVQGTYYQYNGSDWVVYVFPFFKSHSNKITHTLPLLGQTPRLFNSSDVYIGHFSYEAINVPMIEESSTEPQTPIANELLHYTGTTTSDLENGKWYLYDGTEHKWNEVVADTLIHCTSSIVITGFEENKYYIYSTTWTELLSKTVFVPTIYKYELKLTNESGNESNVVEREITALCTSISDLVHSHEHYKELYVEKLSAISANIGMISQGGMGAYDPNRGNYWFLSKMSAEDVGVAGGVEKGAFRVGGEEEYFKVTPLGDDKYSIELKAGNITLTSQGDGTGFKQGTYIYDANDSHKRMALTPTGIIAQVEVNEGTEQQPNWQWNNIASVNMDSYGNIILTNAMTAVKYGIKVTGADIYHLESDLLDENNLNSESLTFDGSLSTITDVMNPLIDITNSSKCFRGSITKNIQEYTGNAIVITKANGLITKGMSDSSIEDGYTVITSKYKSNNYVYCLPDFYANYNQDMRLTSSIDSTKTIGEYIGLNSEQINNGIWF